MTRQFLRKRKIKKFLSRYRFVIVDIRMTLRAKTFAEFFFVFISKNNTFRALGIYLCSVANRDIREEQSDSKQFMNHLVPSHVEIEFITFSVVGCSKVSV